MGEHKRFLTAAGVVTVMASLFMSARQADVPWIRARDIHPELRTADDAALGLTMGILHDRDFIYALDRSEHAIKVFDKTGRYLKSIGRRGQGPGEFNAPSGFSILNDKLYVADASNGRIQILARDGRYLSGFKVPFTPSSIVAVEDDVIAVSYLPSFRRGRENMIHAFSSNGTKLWEKLETNLSGDTVFDTMANRFIIMRGEPGELLAVFKSGKNPMRRFSGDGLLIAAPPPPKGFPIKGLDLPLPGGKKKLWGFCWSASYSDGRLFVLSPDRTDEGDLGPGVEIYVFAPDGPLETVIMLPERTILFSVEGDRIYAVDADRNLRIFQIEKL